MVVDRLENIEKYASLNPLFAHTGLFLTIYYQYATFGSGKNRAQR